MYSVQSSGWVGALLVLAGQPGALSWLGMALVLPVVALSRREVVLWVCLGAPYADTANAAVVAHEVCLGMVWYRTIGIVLHPSVWVLDVGLDL